MRDIDIKILVNWLGRDGAVAGLEESKITVAELSELASRYGLKVEKRARRGELIVDLINWDACRIDKPNEELLDMKYEALKEYLEEKHVSRTELLNLASYFQIPVRREARLNLIDFLAREISDSGMYKRVARGGRA